MLLPACLFESQPGSQPPDDLNPQNLPGFEVKFLAGSALGDFCEQAANQFNQQQPQLDDGSPFYLRCETKGSGDVVQEVVSLTEQLQAGTLAAEAPEFPTLISVDGEIYHSQMAYQVAQIVPGEDYIPAIADAPLLAYSPMVLMTTAEIAPGLTEQENIYKALSEAETHRDLDPNAPQLPIHFVQTAPTRSNSGLQTLVAQFAEVSGKRPEALTVADVEQYRDAVRAIQSKVTRYGASTSSLARSMVANGVFWASIGSVYESSAIAANSELGATATTRYQVVYPDATFTSNMRAILPDAPWVSEAERAAATQVIEFLRSPEIQRIAAEQGLRPGVPGVELGNKFSEQFGVEANPSYDSYRPPAPEVVEAMLESWRIYAKKPSQVALVVDTSGSMQGRKLAAVQNTLLTYIQNLGPREQIIIIEFNSEIQAPIIVEGTPEGRDAGIAYIGQMRARGGTRLYDAALAARNWLSDNLQPEAINAVLILTDGEDSGSAISLAQLEQELQTSDFSSDQRIGFFAIGYGQAGEFNPQALEKIAEVNSGYYRKGDPETIAQVMSDLQVEF
ncbi:MAG: VWA domain-containing protein [Spirulinaceae cyanobacterium SM2_1_0]|nr:VWA domain-containing protein [Spirulinaceae cyanobacterium SM2_1_0]